MGGSLPSPRRRDEGRDGMAGCPLAPAVQGHADRRPPFLANLCTAEQQLKGILRQHGRLQGNDENDVCRMM